MASSLEANCLQGEIPTVLRRHHLCRALSQVWLSALLPAAVYRDLSVSEMRSVNTMRIRPGAMLSSLFSYLSEGHNP